MILASCSRSISVQPVACTYLPTFFVVSDPMQKKSETSTPSKKRSSSRTTSKSTTAKPASAKRGSTRKPSDNGSAKVETKSPHELLAERAQEISKKSAAEILRYNFDSGLYPYKLRMRREAYERQKTQLQVELLKAQAWVKESGEKIAILFEGRDAAGKGGTIKRFTEHLNPRGARVVALEKPTEAERGQWYLQRYVSQLPTVGEIVFFDRSWYNRAGVERVMGFCTRNEYQEFFRQAPEFERMLVKSGIHLFKFYFSVSRIEQLRRFESRRVDPLKRWKLSPIDMKSLDKWHDYTVAKEAMLFYTDTADAPWTIVRSDDKKRARINCMLHVLNSLNYPNKDDSIVKPADPKIVEKASEVIDSSEEPNDSLFG